MLGRTLFVATLAVALGATAAQAQIGGGFPGDRGGLGGMRGGRGGIRSMRPGARVDVPDLRNPLRLIVDNKDDLKLTAAQLQQIDSMKQGLDRQNDTLIAQVKRAFGNDSASLAGRPDDGGRGRSGDPDDAERAARATALRDRLKVLKPTFDLIKRNDDQAWNAATAVLDKDQHKKADRIRNDDRKAWEQARGPLGRWTRDQDNQ